MRARFLFLLIATVLVTSGIRIYEAQNLGPNTLAKALEGKSWSAYGTKTDTSNLQLQAAPGANLRVYITSAYCLNTSAATAQAVRLNYGSGPTYIATLNCPPASKYAEPMVWDSPLAIPANTALTATAVGSVSTTYIVVQGTIAP